MTKKLLVIGMGVSGRASAELLLARGSTVIGVDTNAEALASLQEIQSLEGRGVFVFSDKEPIDISSFDEIVISPGIPSTHPMIEQARRCNIPVIGEAELAFRQLKEHRAVAITGTNGKTTVTLLIEHVLNSSGYKARALGNIGSALSKFLQLLEPGEIIVAELSSYQLETMTTRVFDAAVLLNITPDHLDRYDSMDQYAAAKCRLQGCLKTAAPFFVFSQAAKDFGHLISDHFTTFGEDLSSNFWTDGHVVKESESVEFFFPKEFDSSFKHDSLNALAAWALCKTLGVTKEQFCQALVTFKKPAHRIEFVGLIDGVAYYDDSKGTNIDATLQAVAAMKGPVFLIAGGVDKGSSYLAWKEPFHNKVKEVFVLGQAAEKIRKELGPFFKVTSVGSLSQAIDLAASSALAGDVVLLSPGCSSLDMFRDYAHRGEEFQKCVNKLEERSKNL
ncbi:MAG: UDP-N-acetylmuramoyl-L-alanine--D-glutamate ligase [Chlamydiae bacterium]|nr:UDP-N-acetylmuramoyl-L-alanine--D-glutamate ligase [Chlamydiota bacterium]